MEEWSEMCNIADFENGEREPWTRNAGSPQKMEKEGNLFSTEPQEECNPPIAFILASENCIRFLTYKNVRQ